MRTLGNTSLFFMLLVSLPLMAQKENTDYQYALIEAVKQKNLGNLPGAVELYKMVLEENDSVAVAHYELGTLYALTGKDEDAELQLSIAHSLEPGNKWYFESYIDVLMMREDFRTAEKLLKHRIREEGQKVEYLFKLANVYFMGDRSDKAIRTLEGIEKEYGISAKTTMLKANIYEKKKEYMNARKEVEKLLDVFPESVEFHVVAAELALKNKNSDKAAEIYRKVIELDSMNIYALTNLTDYYREKEEYGKSLFYLERSFHSDQIPYEKKMAILSYYLSDEYFFRNYSSELENLINTIVHMYPEKRKIRVFATDFYIQHNQYGKALDALEPLLVYGESKYEMWRQGILLANATGRDEDMLQISRKAYKIFPDSAEIIYYRGIAEFDSKNYNELLETFSEKNLAKLEDDVVRSQVRALRAEASYRTGNYEVADSLFREIIREDPRNYLVMNNYSYYLSERNEHLDEAERYSYITISNDPENPVYLDTFAWIKYKMGDFQAAEKYIMKALKNGGEKDPEVNEHAGDIHMKLESLDLAQAFYKQAIILGGDKERLEEKIQKINEKKQLH